MQKKWVPGLLILKTKQAVKSIHTALPFLHNSDFDLFLYSYI